MLQTIRDRASGWIAYAIVLLISVPFALWGVNHYLDGGGKQVAAEVGGTSISIQAFARAYREQQMRLEQAFGGKLPSGLNSQTIKQMVLRRLVRDAVFHEAATGAGYQVTDKELLDQLAQYPVFKVDGKFSKTRYEQVLHAQAMVPLQFEGRLRRAIATAQLQGGIQQTAFSTPHQAEQLLRLRDEQRELSFSIIPASRYADSVKVNAKAVKAYYHRHKSDYMTAEKVKLAYLRLDVAGLEKDVKVSDNELRNYFQTHQAQFEQPERATARSIVVDLVSESQGEAAVRLRGIAEGLKKGDSFASLARRYSQAANAKQGGALGEITRGDLPNQVASALFALKPGQVTPPIKVNQKVYRLKLEALHKAAEPSFEAIKAQVKTAYVQFIAQRQFNDEAQRLADLTYKNPGSLEPAAKALGLKVENTGWLTREGGGQGVGANAKVLQAAFSTEVLNNGSNSQPLQLGQHEVVVVRALEHKTPEQKPLDEVRAAIRRVLAKQAADKQAEKVGKALIADLNSGKSLAGVAPGGKSSVHVLGWVGRQGAKDIPASVVTAAFQLPAPASGKSGAGGVRLNNGNYAIFEITGVKRPEPDAKQVGMVQGQLAHLFGQVELQVVYQALERADKVKVYPNNLNF
ncbi:MAG: SurA N-terminal domain-containing protein [Acidihalobacter sp.]|uniref:SurA N-terminal domain-containing protein n=1 Tax=Acidihalobacter sp. TaxID=1872108 RepID=UPI00307CDEA6